MILHEKKWPINCPYNPNKNNIKNLLEIISKALYAFPTKYKNIILLGDFKVCVDDETMRNFCISYNLNSASLNNQHALKIKRIVVALI